MESVCSQFNDSPNEGHAYWPSYYFTVEFVREDIPREDVARQIALAIREETIDLEKEGINTVQIDEPAIREGLPLRKVEQQAYLDQAVEAFKLSSCGVKGSTQIHTHMCYSDFNEIIEAIANLDADVISIETSRSAMELLDVFREFKYPNEIGPGVYDIHSPRIPSVDEIAHHIRSILKYISAEQVWINPDCGLKTRNNQEVQTALINMQKATELIRSEIKEGALANS